MLSPPIQADRRLRADRRRPYRGARRPGWRHRLAVLAPLRQRCVSLRPARGRAARRLAPRPDRTRGCVARLLRRYPMSFRPSSAPAGGVLRLTDFMPIGEDDVSAVIRRLEVREGEVEVETALSLRFGYGEISPWFSALEWPRHGGFSGEVGPDLVVLRGPGLSRDSDVLRARFTLSAGERADYVLQHACSARPIPDPIDPEKALARTLGGLAGLDRPLRPEDGLARSSEAFAPDAQSADAYAPSGEHRRRAHARPAGKARAVDELGLSLLLAAQTPPSPSPPCSMPDSTKKRRRGCAGCCGPWPGRRTRCGSCIVSTAAGKLRNARSTTCRDGTAPDLCASAMRPRGSASSTCTGKCWIAFACAKERAFPSNANAFAISARLVAHVERIWREPDRGMWESRGKPQHYVYSKVMAWVAVDRLLRLDDRDGGCTHDRRAELEALRDAIHADVCAQGFDPDATASCRLMGPAGSTPARFCFPLSVSASERRADRRHYCCDRAGTDGGRPGAPARGAVAWPRGRRLPPLHLLAGGLHGDAEPPRRRRAPCSSACWPCPTTSDCYPRSTTSRRAACSVTSRRR